MAPPAGPWILDKHHGPWGNLQCVYDPPDGIPKALLLRGQRGLLGTVFTSATTITTTTELHS